MISYFARHPTAANILMIAIMVLGIAKVWDLNRETFPRLPQLDVDVGVVWPGASAGQVEDSLCRPLEDAVEGISNLEETVCTASEGKATLVASMREGTNASTFLDDVRAEVDALDTLPDDSERPTTVLKDRTDFVASLSLTGPMTAQDLRDLALDLKDRMLRFGGIPMVAVQGFSDRQIRIEVPRTTLRALGLSMADIARAIENQNQDLPAGVLQTRESDVLLRVGEDRRRPTNFLDLVVLGGVEGGVIHLGDIATITDTFQDAEKKILRDGVRAALLQVSKTPADDSLKVLARVQAFLDRERARLPSQVTLEITTDVSSIIEDRLSLLVDNGVQGLVLVFLSMWLFFGFRFSFWVSAGLPVAFLGAIFLMTVFGYTLNMITMVALLIAIGLMMDDAIVISENIAARLSKGDSPMDAAIQGTLQVLPGVVSSFLTTIMVFGALIFLEGNMGAILGVLPVVLIMVLTVSLIEAFLILPHHLAHSLEHAARKPPSRFRLGFERRFGQFRDGYVDGIVRRAVGHPGLTLGLLFMVLIFSFGLVASGAVKMEAFPDLEGDVIEARVLLPQGTPLARTEEIADRILAASRTINGEYRERQPEGADIIHGVTTQFSVNSDVGEVGPHVVTVGLDLLSSEVRRGSTTELINRLRELVGDQPDVVTIHYAQRERGPAGKALEIRLTGDDLDALKSASLGLQVWLRGYDGVHDTYDDLRPGKPEITLISRDTALALGVTAKDLADQTRAGFQGLIVDEFRVGPETFEVDLRLTETDRNDLADLDDFVIVTPQGDTVPLGAVAHIKQTKGWARILRVDGQRTVTVSGDVDSRMANANEITRHLTTTFLPELLSRHPGVRSSLEGQAAEGGKTGKSILGNFLIGLIGVFLLLSFQFRSYVEPIMVMAAIPMGFVGSILGHLVLGLDISMPSLVGLTSLAGVVVNDSILLVQFLKEKRGQGMPPADAAVAAARERFRPILLTSLTTVLGLGPLLTETSLQAQVLIPLATSLAFGLTVSTFLALILVPAFYVLLADWKVIGRDLADPAPPANSPGKGAPSV
ncbi:MAG: efflux RND transporter permease subunit [Rhodospirillum sp.]|nr:efflux RND transporter permease subunit [Rhodospirillum sp.]MCF8489858.1 efflux RND transporter permease subunit [Rhodospirillum sp.]MCF8499421.1 efflux RND transporter permease subunit [Rhodospirillum sp.]